jgi:hypothetical protein
MCEEISSELSGPACDGLGRTDRGNSDDLAEGIDCSLGVIEGKACGGQVEPGQTQLPQTPMLGWCLLVDLDSLLCELLRGFRVFSAAKPQVGGGPIEELFYTGEIQHPGEHGPGLHDLGSFVSSGEAASFQASACSRPPEPIRRTFIGSDIPPNEGVWHARIRACCA